MTYVITQPCCNDATCVTVCPVACIHPTPEDPGYATAEMLYIDPLSCIDCGACVDVCPVGAILPDSDLTPDTQIYAEVNAAHYNGRHYPGQAVVTERGLEPSKQTLSVAIVGSGPAALYTAEALLARRDVDVEVHIFERLPTPWGLVRYGVAPDHPSTKDISKVFKKTAARKDFTFHLNVEVGRHIFHGELLAHHHAVVYAVGATQDKRLGITGEDLPGSHSATEFVAWYNGHPDFSNLEFDFSHRRAVVVGNGNVALDVARVLLTDPGVLARTDIADHALNALSNSQIREVVILGRRGVGQAAFTTPELLGLRSVTGVDVTVDPCEMVIDEATRACWSDYPDADSVLKARLTAEISGSAAAGHDRQLSLRFGWSPTTVLGGDCVKGLQAVRNTLIYEGGQVRPHPTTESLDLTCGLLLRAVGYRGAPLADLPFDENRGTLPHRGGRVVAPGTGVPIRGVYAAGWIKRGPSGVIGTNRWCAAETVGALLEDHANHRLPAPERDRLALAELIAHRQPRALDRQGWQLLDAHERLLAKGTGRPRIKIVDAQEMLDVVEHSSSPR